MALFKQVLAELIHHWLNTYSPLTTGSPLTHPLLRTDSPLIASFTQLESTGTGGWVDEIQNKAEAQPAWLKLAARA